MKRVILDTNIYGFIVVDEDRNIREYLEKEKITIIYGLSLIRKELRDTPKNIKIGGIKLRNDLLSVYDKITKNHILKLNNSAEGLADSYFDIYKELGGHSSKSEIIKDFIIVACATLNSLDIVVSNDNKTMISETALKSYNIVNQIKKIKMPRFLSYEKFKKELRL